MNAILDKVKIDGERMRVHFDRFDIEHYALFLRVKALPEYELDYHVESETYTVTAPSRFAHILGVTSDCHDRDWLPMPEFLFDDQVAIVRMALDAKRFAVWSDCGLGKTAVQLEWARQVAHKSGGRVLIITLNDIVNQTIEEASKFYGDSLPVKRISTRDEMKLWACDLTQSGGVAITNYEKMNPDRDGGEVVNELRYLAGIVLDESSRLKTGGGKQKWALIKSCRGIPYKLSCTATPAPNDIMEFASQASFLEKMRSEGEIIWTYFVRDAKTQEWTVKRYAREAFFKFMSSWSIYVRDPRRYGWRKGMATIPEPEVFQYSVPITDEQRKYLGVATAANDGQMSLIDSHKMGIVQRMRMSQAAKGFLYLNKHSPGKVLRIESAKPSFVADLIRREVGAGLQVLCWTVFDAESDLLAEQLSGGGDVQFDVLTGKVKDTDRLAILDRFRRGESRCLISKAVLLGYGLNLQCCGSMIFSGWNDSYEQWYQAIRRAYRYGQTQRLRVHIPVVPELEGDMLENIFSKQSVHEASISEMEQNYISQKVVCLSDPHGA